MRILSRHMPKYHHRRPGLLSWLVLAVLVVAMLAWLSSALFRHPVPTLAVISVLTVLVAVSSRVNKRKRATEALLTDSTLLRV